MNPNMVPARPVMGQPIFIPGFNEAFAVPPPAGPVFYPQPVSSPGVPYNISRPFQSSPSYQYQPQLQSKYIYPSSIVKNRAFRYLLCMSNFFRNLSNHQCHNLRNFVCSFRITGYKVCATFMVDVY